MATHRETDSGFLAQLETVLSRDLSDDVKKHLVTVLDARDHEAARQRLERSKWLSSTPLAVALAGLVTVAGNFAFDFWRGKAETENFVTQETLRNELSASNERLKGELAQAAAVTETDLAIKSEEKRFQFEIMRTELAKPDSTESERIQTLLFLARSGVLNDLDVEELKSMAMDAQAELGKETGETVTRVTIPTLTEPSASSAILSRSDIATLQTLVCLTPDGIIGPVTEQELIKYLVHRDLKDDSDPAALTYSDRSRLKTELSWMHSMYGFSAATNELRAEFDLPPCSPSSSPQREQGAR